MTFSSDDAARFVRALAQLDDIHAATATLGAQMATVTEALNTLAVSMTGLETDVARVLEVLANQPLTPEAQAAVDALQARFDALNTNLDTAAPPTP